MRSKKIAATLIALTAATVLTACSDSSSSSDDFNKADVTFAQDMIPHHRQATEMAAMAASRTDDEQILALAADIEAAQAPEIETMTGWLESWDEEVPEEMSGDMEGMDHSGMSDMPGMMSDDDMAMLRNAEGAEFNEAFLAMMIEHHTGAIKMAKTEEKDGKYVHAVRLAKQIQKDQAAEIDEMEELLRP